MEKIITLFLTLSCIYASTLKRYCDRCHTKMLPYQMLYKRALLLYSSKRSIKEHLSAFLLHPNPQNSILPPGLKHRFDPSKHPIFSKKIAKEAIEELIEKEDILKKLQP